MNGPWSQRVQLLRETRRRRRRPGRATATLAGLALVATAGAAYTVQPGDTLSELAHRHGVSVRDLVATNDIADPDRIVVGQRLRIPGGSGASGGSSGNGSGASARTHVVATGESLGGIARRYGLSVGQLAAANGLTDPDRVLAGMLLRVAAGPPPPPGTDAGGGGGTYRVRPGDALSTIARRVGSSVRALVRANDLASPDRIRAGQVLQVPGGSGNGPGWACVVPGGRWTDDFGVAKPDGRHHEGIDVYADRGTVVRAPVGGTIRYTRGSRGGLQFVLRGRDGYTYVGTHMDSYGSDGRVDRGDAIGTVGTTGNARGTPPHLHFEMHHGSVVNPHPTLQRYC